MFKKPKKKPAALRSTKNDETTTNITSSSSKKRRRHSDDESSSSDDDEKNATQDLLQQLRDERSNNTNSSSKKINTSSTLTKKNPSMMHQYKSNNDMLTAQQMATRTAEHHPVEKSTNDTSNNNINAHLPSLQSNQPRSKFLAGPLKAPTFVRTTARFDYQPDICKDYKETGFCGYGDTCIYLHDRGDTKSGWEMEREYEEKKRGEDEKKRGEVEKFMRSMMTDDGNTNEEEDGFGKEETIEEDGIPFACHICRGPFRNPIVTSCQHYFCEACMSTRVKKVGTGCPICSKDTHGVLNFPQKLMGKKRRLIGRDGSWEEFFKKNKKQL